MTELTSIQKEQLLCQVQRQGHLIRVCEIAKLIKKYDNLEVEDFAPPILPLEIYEQLIDLFTYYQEEDAWKQLLQRPKGSEEELNELIREIESYISNYKSLRLSHVTEASSMLQDYRNRLVLLKEERELKEERRAWECVVNMPHLTEHELYKFIQEHVDSPYIHEARKLLAMQHTQTKKMLHSKPVTYIQKVTSHDSERSHKTDISHIYDSNIWLCTECHQIIKINDEDNLFCPSCGGKLKEFEKVRPMGKQGPSNCLLGLLKMPFSLMCLLTSNIYSLVKDRIVSIGSNDNEKDVLYGKVFSSIYAPAEVKPKSHMQVQAYLHLYEETEKVKALAQESDEDAERRDYIPLQCKLKKGDMVDVQLNIYGETLLMSDKKSVVWQVSFTKCSFDYFVPTDIDVDELSCVALLTVNEIPIGEMRFITKIVESPRKLNPEIIAHKYNKVFISYAHKDEEKVKSFHEGLKLVGIEHFFDRAYLKTGDIFPQVIQDYINSADLFVLFWSENASKSEYVDKERKQALERAFPQVRPQQKAKLSIYPMSIEPRAELPNDMKNNYHFGEL